MQVKADKDYRISGYIKTDDLDGFCQIQLSFLDEEGCSLHNVRELPGGKQCHGTNDWIQDIIECRSPQKATALEIRLMVVGNGKVWFDDFDLIETVSEEETTDMVLDEERDAQAEDEEDKIKKRLERLGYLG